MAKTVNQAFAQFLSATVNLDPAVTKTARASRDWLRGQLLLLSGEHGGLPLSLQERDIDFGSLSRRTKIRPLDDIDLIFCMHGEGSTYVEFGGVLHITVPAGARLRDMCDDGTDQLNSRKVINRFVKHLSGVPRYGKAEVKRNGEAAVLNLLSYPWSFDIVPGFFTSREADGRDYYVIPDGNGRWKKTDPRIDHHRVTQINQRHSGMVLNPLRLTKYWNRRGIMPTIPPYLLETMILAHYDGLFATCSQFPHLAFRSILSAIESAVMRPAYDPKRIQGDLNTLSFEERLGIVARIKKDADAADAAVAAEQAGDHSKAIGLWQSVFGPAFPSYG